MKPITSEINNIYIQIKKKHASKDKSSPLHSKLKAAQKLLRRAQRQLAAKKRKENHAAIIDACHKKDRTGFYKLVNKQRNSRSSPSQVAFGERTGDTPANSWGNYFEYLATPGDDAVYDANHMKMIELNNLLQKLTATGKTVPPVSKSDIRKLICSLKRGKAPDIYGITSEHIKYADNQIEEVLCIISNKCIASGKLPDCFKLGSVTPVPKKAKSPKDPNSYRRITITAIVGKIVEMHMVNHTRPILDQQQSRLQFGFSHGCSPVMAALILSEVIANAKDNDEELIITLLDTSKAFDVVSHPIMLNALHQQGIHGNLWQLYSNMYSGIKSAVKWNNDTSLPFPELQGIRQGGTSSADSYKAGRNKILNLLDKRPSHKIGQISAGAVMVADDIALCSSNLLDLQCAINATSIDANRDRFKFNTTKSKILAINCKEPPELKLNNQLLSVSTKEPHLGIIRNMSGSNMDTVKERIKSARRTAYSLMGAGLHGLNGVGPAVSMSMYNSYVIPVLMYGLEALVLTTAETEAIETYHRTTLRQLQHLPKSTAIPAIYLLAGALPAEGLCDTRVLLLFGH